MTCARWEISRSEGTAYAALVCGSRVWMSTDLYQHARRMATALVSLGLRPGARVIVALPNSYELFVAFSATLLAGGVVVVLGNAAQGSLTASIEHCQPAMLFVQRPLSGTDIGSSVLQISVDADETRRYSRMSDLIASHEAINAPVRRDGTDLAQLCYTSGTSGKPKAVEYSHAVLDAFRNARSMLESESNTVLLTVPPSAFSSRFLLAHATSGQKYILLEGCEPGAVLRMMEDWQVTEIPLVPTMAKRLLTYLPDRIHDCQSLKAINIAGSHVSAALSRELTAWFERFCQASSLRIVVNYGSTEAGGGISSTSSARGFCVGSALPGVTIRVLGNDGRNVAIGERGEVVVQTPYAGRAYWREPELSEQVFVSGFVRTGDIGYLDASNELFLTGRRCDVIIQGGFNVDPLEVSAVVERIEGVAECGVIGIQSDFLGEQVVACVVEKVPGNVGEGLIRERCRGLLDRRKLPTLILFLERLPRTDTGKINVTALRDAAISMLGHTQQQCRSHVLHSRMSDSPQGSLEEFVQHAVSEIVAQNGGAGSVDRATTFGDMGLDSVGAVQLAHVLSANLGISVPQTIAFSEPTIPALVRWLDGKLSG